MKYRLLITVFILIVILGAWFVLGNKTSTPYTISDELGAFFQDEITRAGVERVGQPIEGFNANIFLEAFPGFTEEDFDGVEALEGVYTIQDGELVYTRTAGNPVTSAEETISTQGYKTLLSNFSERLEVEVKSESDIATLLEKLRESDEVLASYISDDFSIWHPEGWYGHENNNSVFFTHNEEFDVPANTEGFALGPWFQVSVIQIGEGGNPKSVEELFEQNLWIEGSEFLVSEAAVTVNGLEGMRVVTNAAGASGEVLYYVFSPDDERIFTLSQYPYVQNSRDTDDFERAVRTFMPNFIIENTDNGNEGILPFDSGVTGKILLGPTCPVLKDPPDHTCDDKPYRTTVQIIAAGSPKSSPFATVESDKAGNYKVFLPPGEYGIQAIGANPFPRCETKTVTVEPDTMHNIDLLCDTGIR